jgi:hypothetical protein
MMIAYVLSFAPDRGVTEKKKRDKENSGYMDTTVPSTSISQSMNISHGH